LKKAKNVKYLFLSVLTFFILGCPPCLVTITSPSHGANFEVGEEITFTGSAKDLLEGKLPDSSLVWTSDKDAKIGTGKEFKRNDLSEGTHEITLTATNSRGEKGTATITITIGGETSTTTTTLITTTTTSDSGIKAPKFTIEPGVRIDYASNAKAGYNDDPTVGAVGTYMYYQDRSGMKETTQEGGDLGPLYAFSEDGLTFDEPTTVETVPGACNDGSEGMMNIAHPERLELPDGSGWRMYSLYFKNIDSTMVFESFKSSFSGDGVLFCEEEGSRYNLGPNDQGTMGVYTTFAAEHSDTSQVVLLYLGDLYGVNNLRRAVADGDGYEFVWDRDNVLGDAGNKSSELYVDVSTVPTEVEGIRRLYAMRGGGGIYSFITTDDGKTFEQEEGARVLARDFDDALPENEYVCGVFDPTIVQYHDENGSITSTRMYMTGDIWDSTGTWQDGSEEGNCTIECNFL
jgi:hypothetical protein